MSENRFWFVIDKGKLEYVQDNVTGEKITVSELEDLLNEQQATIIELERKLKKYAKIGGVQLKQITDLQDELNECRARHTNERGVVKVEYR